MTGHDGSMREVLNGYAKFLQEKNLALDMHQPYLVRWVAEFKTKASSPLDSLPGES